VDGIYVYGACRCGIDGHSWLTQPHRRITRCMDFSNVPAADVTADYHGRTERARKKGRSRPSVRQAAASGDA